MKPLIETNFGPIYQNWKLCKFPEYVFFQEGPGLRKWQWTDAGMKVINVKNILLDGSIDLSNSDKYISIEEFEQKYSHFAINDGDILVSSSGWSYGKVGKINKSHLPVMINTSVIRFRPLSNATLDADYLYAFLRSSFFQNQIESFIIGVQQPNFGPSHVKEMIIPIPPLSTQQKIAAILSAYDDLIENNTRRIAVLEAMAQTIYREWFAKFRFPGHEGVRLVESEIGSVPEGWKVVKLGDIAQEIRRSVEPGQVDPDTPYIGLEHLPRKSIALTEWGTADQIQSTKLLFKKGEILFGKIRPYFHKVGVAPIDGICSTDIIVILAKCPEYFPLVLSCVSSEHFVDYATQTSQGTKMPRADWKVLVKYPVVLPSKPILMQFNELIQDIVAQIHNLIFRNRNLRRTRDLLLPRLISGEVDVAEVEITVRN